MSVSIVTRAASVALALALLVAAPFAASAQTQEGDPWYGSEAGGDPEVHLYFAWSSTCPHCARAKPFVATLDDRYSWLAVHWLQVNDDNEENVEFVVALAGSLGETIQAVPAFLYCETVSIGYLSDEVTGAQLENDLTACHDRLLAEMPFDEPGAGEVISLPILGTIDPETVSLPLLTVVLAGLDAFNPCTFFVLLFLLSLLVHARSRSRMAAVCGTFVLVSGVVYFGFMAAWLNVFLLFGALPAVTLVAGLVVVAIASVNIKDYFWFKRGVTLSVPDSAQNRLFGRMRRLTASTSFPLMMLGTVTLAFAANSYELLCTAGFPLVFTRVLTMNDLPSATYYGYLALYNIVYVVPLLLIVAGFVLTLGRTKLTERGGRILKLLSGLMMLGLGLVLVFAPGLLENLLVSPLLLLGALLLTGVLVLFERWRTPPAVTPSTREREGV